MSLTVADIERVAVLCREHAPANPLDADCFVFYWPSRHIEYVEVWEPVHDHLSDVEELTPYAWLIPVKERQ